MPAIASYRQRLKPSPETHAENSFVAFGLNDDQHVHDWKCKPSEQQPLAAENKFIWHCSGCNEMKTLDSWLKP
jgi:hypothetical protein